jgi:hypothetical protein
VRLDGGLLACNDAALSLLGGGPRPAILNTNLSDCLVPGQRAQWQEFTSRCWSEGAASFECDLLLRDHTSRRVLVQAVALTEHPDGLESLLLHVREQPPGQRVEQSTGSAATDRHSEATFAALEKKLERSQLAALQKEREYGRDVAMLKAALAAAHAAKATAIAEQGRLQAIVADHDAERDRVAADHRVAVDALRQSLVEAVAEQSRIAARAEEPTRELDLLRAEHHRALAHLKTATGVVADYRRQISEGSAEQGRLAARIEEHERERNALIAARQRALAELETRDKALADLRAEQERLQARVAAYEADRARTAGEHQAAVAALEQSLAQALDEQTDMRAQLARTSAEHASGSRRGSASWSCCAPRMRVHRSSSSPSIHGCLPTSRPAGAGRSTTYDCSRRARSTSCARSWGRRSPTNVA